MLDDLDPEEVAVTARAVIAACDGVADAAARGRLLAQAGLLGVIAPESVGGLALPLRFALPVVQAAGAGLLAYPVIEAMLLARHLAQSAPDLAAAIIEGQSLATIAWSGLAEEGAVGHAPMGDNAAKVLVFRASGDAALAGKASVTPAPHASGLDVDLPDYALTIGAGLHPALDTAQVVALRADAALLRAGFILGSAGQCLSLATGYAQDRVQFGTPISANQVLRHRLSRDAMTIQALRAGLTRALGEPAEDPAMAREAVWLWAAQTGITVAESAIQVFGGMGFTWDVPLHRHLRQMQAQAVRGGAVAGLDALAAELLAWGHNEWYADLANAS